MINITPASMELSRIAAQAAAQTIKQGIKNIERERFYDKFQDKEGQLLKAKVTKVHTDSVILDIEGTTVVLPPESQIPNRPYELGEEIFVFLKKICKEAGGITLEITQASGDYVTAISWDRARLTPESVRSRITEFCGLEDFSSFGDVELSKERFWASLEMDS